MEKFCVLDEDRLCDDCGDCLKCDLDQDKTCDNCMRCVQKSDADYLAIEIDEVIGGTNPDTESSVPVRKAAATGGSSAKASIRAVRPKSPRKRPS